MLSGCPELPPSSLLSSKEGQLQEFPIWYTFPIPLLEERPLFLPLPLSTRCWVCLEVGASPTLLSVHGRSPSRCMKSNLDGWVGFGRALEQAWPRGLCLCHLLPTLLPGSWMMAQTALGCQGIESRCQERADVKEVFLGGSAPLPRAQELRWCRLAQGLEERDSRQQGLQSGGSCQDLFSL